MVPSGASGAFSAGVVPNNTQCKGVDPASAEGHKKQQGVTAEQATSSGVYIPGIMARWRF